MHQNVLPQFFLVRSISFGENVISFSMLITGRALEGQDSVRNDINMVRNVQREKHFRSLTCTQTQSQTRSRQPGQDRSSCPGPCCLPESSQTTWLLACRAGPKENQASWLEPLLLPRIHISVTYNKLTSIWSKVEMSSFFSKLQPAEVCFFLN